MMSRVPAVSAGKVHCRRIHTHTSLEALSETFSALPSPSILGGNRAKGDADGFRCWAAEPMDVFEFTSAQTDPFSRLQNILTRYGLTDPSRMDLPSSGMFYGGWIGYFGYELGRHIERLPGRAVDDVDLDKRLIYVRAKLVNGEHGQPKTKRNRVGPKLRFIRPAAEEVAS